MTEIKLEQEAIDAMFEGLNAAVDTVKKTMGAKGKFIHIKTAHGMHSTLDGVSVISMVDLEDKVKQMGVEMAQEVAIKQVDDCGDGTTSVSVLLQALIEKGLKMVAAKADPIKIKKGIEIAANEAIEIIKGMSKQIERDGKEIEQIAKVSAHGDSDMAKLIAEAVAMTNENSIIRVEEATGVESHIDLAKGMKVGSGWLSPLFVNNPSKATVEHEHPLVMVYEGKIEMLAQIQHLLEGCVEAKRPLVIISDNMDGEVLASLAVNAKKGFKFAAINPWGETKNDMKDRLQDLALYTGAKLLSPDLGHELEEVKLEDLGTCKSIVISHDNTVFQDGAGLGTDKLMDRVSDLQSLVKNTDNVVSKTFYEARLAALNGGVATIYVGGVIGTDIGERKDRIDDAVGASLSALEEGVVPGGGVSLLQVSKELESKPKEEDSDIQIGIDIFKEAITMPIRQILLNAGENAEFIIETVKTNKSKNYGYNVYTGEYVDMVKEGILDPAKVEIKIIENATAAATKFLNTGGLIVEK